MKYRDYIISVSVNAELHSSGALCDIFLEENFVLFLVLSQYLLRTLYLYLFNHFFSRKAK